MRRGYESVVEDPTYEFKKITDHRQDRNAKLSYFVVWKNTDIEPSWESVENFYDVNVIKKYWKSVRPSHRSKKSHE